MIDTSAQNALKNSVYNLIGFLFPIVVLVIFTPIIIEHLGVETYGVYIFLNTILAFLSLLELGIGTATNKHVVEYHSTGQTERLKRLLRSMNSIYLIQGITYLVACLVIGVLIPSISAGPESQNYPLLLLIVGLSGLIPCAFANFTNTLIAIQRYDIHIKISSAVLLLSSTSMLMLAVTGYSLVAILVAQLIVNALGSLAYFLATRKVFPILELRYRWHSDELKKNYSFALPIAFNNIANSSLIHFDKLLIPALLGSASLTYYSVPGSIATKISSVSGTFSSLLFPITVNLHALNDTDKIKRVYARSVRLIAILSSAISLSIIFLADKVLLYWLGEDFARTSVTVLILLVLTNLVLALFSPLSNLLMATNRLRFLTASSFAMAGINAIALIVLLPLMGINGAALAYLISVLFIFWMFRYSEKNFFHIHDQANRKLLLKLTTTAVPFSLIVAFALNPLVTSIYALAIIGPASVGLFMLLYKLFGFFPQEDWNDFKISFSRILSKLSIKI